MTRDRDVLRMYEHVCTAPNHSAIRVGAFVRTIPCGSASTMSRELSGLVYGSPT